MTKRGTKIDSSPRDQSRDGSAALPSQLSSATQSRGASASPDREGCQDLLISTLALEEESPGRDGAQQPCSSRNDSMQQAVPTSHGSYNRAWRYTPDPLLKLLMREAVREELLCFFGPDGGFHLPVGAGSALNADACQAAPDQHHNGSKPAVDETCQPEDSRARRQPLEPAAEAQKRPLEDAAEAELDLEGLHRTTAHDHFSKFVDGGLDAIGLERGSQSTGFTEGEMSRALSLHQAYFSTSQWFRRRMMKLWALEEPRRVGVLARLVESSLFEKTVQLVILANCVFMLISANWEVRNPHAKPGVLSEAIGIFFQVFYTCELVLKILVHRWFFFWNGDCGFNTFDFFLVVIGFADLLLSSSLGGSTVLRSARILKLGKALRALRVISQFNQLRAILVCIYGSFSMLFFSILMLSIVFFMFSLIFVQQVAERFKQLPDGQDPFSQFADGQGPWSGEDTVILSLASQFGSVQLCMLTLYMAVFGGEDWNVPFNAISECGWVATCLFLVFVAFANIALINVITGLFVDAAMMNLQPDSEQKSLDLEKREEDMAKELEKLCLAVDDDETGSLNKEEFREGLKQGRIPLLLHLLGLNKEHVKAFFDLLCDHSPDNAVNISNFVRGCMRLRGSATSFDLQLMHVDLMRFHKLQEREMRIVMGRLGAVESAVSSQVSAGRHAVP